MNETTEPEKRDSLMHRMGKRLAGPPQDRDELVAILREARVNGLLDNDALWMMQGALSVSELQVRDIMVPRSQMVVVEQDDVLDHIVSAMIESGHSRFPVIGESRDEVAGMLLAKDLLRLARDDETSADFVIDAVLRPAVFVPEAKRVNVMLKEFRVSHNHIAVVVDEYGGVSGLVTIEDALEQIVGEIDDEYDQEQGANILQQDENCFLVRGLTPMDELNAYFGTAFESGEFDTIGGIVMHTFGHVPKRGESLQIGRLVFNVQGADLRRVHLLQVTALPEDDD